MQLYSNIYFIFAPGLIEITMMLLVNKAKLDFIKEAIKQQKCVINFTKNDAYFLRTYKMTPNQMKAELKGLEREIMSCEKDMNDGTNDRITALKLSILEEQKNGKPK